MTVNITINIGQDADAGSNATRAVDRGRARSDLGSGTVTTEPTEMNFADSKPFPRARLGGYMSHFRIVLELDMGDEKPRLVSIVSPMAAQTVSWSDPFIYRGPQEQHEARITLPAKSQLSNIIRESDFLEKPEEYFEIGKETMWLQILNLDARMDTEIGPMRIILGETLRREHPDIFRPSFGVAQSLGKSGFPARLYFNPYALIETSVGSFRAIHGTLAYSPVAAFPPIGTPVSIADCIPIEPVDEVRSLMKSKSLLVHQLDSVNVPSMGRIIALSHPIDMEIQLTGEEIYDFVERCVAGEYTMGPLPTARGA